MYVLGLLCLSVRFVAYKKIRTEELVLLTFLILKFLEKLPKHYNFDTNFTWRPPCVTFRISSIMIPKLAKYLSEPKVLQTQFVDSHKIHVL